MSVEYTMEDSSEKGKHEGPGADPTYGRDVPVCKDTYGTSS